MVESSVMPINQPHTLEAPAAGDLQLPAAPGNSEKQNPIPTAGGEPHHNPPTKSARQAIEFYSRWTIIVLNVGLELAQIILTLEASGGRIKGPTYRTLTATTSSICLLLSALEVFAKNGVVSSPPKKKRARIGRLAVWFGLVSAAVQFSVNVAALAVKRAVVSVDYLGLLFSVCYFFAAINGHGSSEAEGTFVDGIWVFECSLCTAQKHA